MDGKDGILVQAKPILLEFHKDTLLRPVMQLKLNASLEVALKLAHQQRPLHVLLVNMHSNKRVDQSDGQFVTTVQQDIFALAAL
jgi:hypothetical protein